MAFTVVVSKYLHMEVCTNLLLITSFSFILAYFYWLFLNIHVEDTLFINLISGSEMGYPMMYMYDKKGDIGAKWVR